MPKGPPPPRPGSTAKFGQVRAEPSAVQPQGEPAAVPYRDRIPTLRDSPAPPSQRVHSDEPTRRISQASLAAARDAAGADDPVAMLRRELDESHKMQGRLLAQVGDLSERLAHVQQSIPPPAPPAKVEVPEVELPTPAAWKAALFKLVVSLGAVATAVSVWLGARNASLPPKVDAQEVRTTVNEKKADGAATDVAALRGRLAALEQRERERTVYWIEVERLQGVQVKRPEGLPPAQQLDVVVPLRRPGEVSSGPSLIINTPPP